MSINVKTEIALLLVANIFRPGGGEDIYFENIGELKRYNADPDGYAAAYYGLSKIDYLQWIDSDGTARCGHRKKDGDLCRRYFGPTQLSAGEWKAMNRSYYCAAHRVRSLDTKIPANSSLKKSR